MSTSRPALSIAVYALTGNIGSVSLGGTGTSVNLTGTNLTNNLGLSVPANASLGVVGVVGNLGGLSLAANSTAYLYGTQITNNQGLSVPAGASLSLGGMVGNLGSVTLGGAWQQVVRRYPGYDCGAVPHQQSRLGSPGRGYRGHQQPFGKLGDRNARGNGPNLQINPPVFNPVVDQYLLAIPSLTNDQGLNVPSGASLTVNFLTGHLGNITQAPNSSVTINQMVPSGPLGAAT